MKINHINYPDDTNSVFCKYQNSIVKLTHKFWKTCFKCPYFNGTYQGNGVECLYDDTDTSPIVYSDNAKIAYEYNKD